MSTEDLIRKNEMFDVFKEMAENSIAFAIVANDGRVAYHYAMTGYINKDPHAAASIIRVVDRLLAKHDENK